MSLLKPFIFFVALVWDRSSDGVEQFDYYTVAYQWPRTFQEIFREENNLPYVSVNYWTIHGFWPSRNNGHHPRYCNNADEFNLTIIPQNVKDRMQEMWPNLGYGDNQQFWRRQWNTHGTCSGKGVIEYFTKAIELSDQYNIMQILSNKDIRPSNKYEYNIAAIEKVIKNLTKKWPTIKQREVYIDDTPWLFEIHICFDRKYNVQNCPGSAGYFLHYPLSVKAPPLPMQQKMLNGQNSVSFSYSFVILIVILSNV